MAGFLASNSALLVLLSTVLAGVVMALVLLLLRSKRRQFASPLQKATFSTLHMVSLTGPILRVGLSNVSADLALPYLRTLLVTCGLTMTDAKGAVLAWDGECDYHVPDVQELARRVLNTGRQQVVARHSAINCGRGDCPARGLVVSPLEIEGRLVGTLGALTESAPGPVILRATAQVARYVSSQLELAELDESRSRLARAEVRALRAQISPHFVFNSLNTIASFIRTEPERARELLHDFAEFNRYSFRGGGEFTTLKDELANIERYVKLERARFGENLNMQLRIAPEVLQVTLPFLALQPLVENAIRHGLSSRPELGTVVLTAANEGAECVITVEDDGVGMDPSRLGEDSADVHLSGAHVGMGNVHDRMRSAFGDDFGLVVDTALGAGTKITLRVPKFRAGVSA